MGLNYFVYTPSSNDCDDLYCYMYFSGFLEGKFQLKVRKIMGVKYLWKIIDEEGKDVVDVKSLSGQTIAVDLSAWVVELKNTQGLPPNLYIK